MAVRFIIGRAGSGKTHRVLRSVHERLRHDPVSGPRLIVLVPEQASLHMERTIVDGAPRGASHRAEVVSFQRLAFRILESAGPVRSQAITEPARTMLLRHLAQRHARDLRYYRRVERFPGFAQRLSRTVAELIQDDVEPDDFGRLLDEQPADAVDSSQACKLHDIALLYRAYLEALGGDRLDPTQHLLLARSLLPRCAWLHGAELWVDGFASFARQELLMLASLAGMCSSAEVSLLGDPSLLDSAPAPELSRLFGRMWRTYGELHRAFVEAGQIIDPPVRLMGDPPPRFAPGSALARIERHMFRRSAAVSSSPAASSTGADHSSAHAEPPGCGVESSPPPADPEIEAVSFPTRRLEVEYAVARIADWVQSPRTGYRYRDVAVIVRDLEPYHDILSAALTARGIPFFIDRRRPTGHHPLVELIRAAPSMRVEDMPLEAVRLALKTGLILPDTDVGDLLENYLLAHGVRGWRVWAGEDWRWHPFGRRGETEVDADEAAQVERVLASLNEARRAVVAGLAKWMEAARDPDERDGEEWRAEILDLLRALNVPARLAEWTRVADERGDLDQGEEHRQSWRDLLELLDDLGFALKGTVLTAPELAAVLEAGFAEFTLGLAPPMLDQVLVGAIERSRQPDLKAAVLLGFNDGMYPRAAGEDTILNDDDRTLFEQSGQRVGQLARTRTVEEPLLVYVALTRPARRLVLTWATADEQGRELRVSPYLKSLCEALPGLSVRIGGDPARDRATWDIHTMSDAAGRLATEFRERPPANRDDPAVRGMFNALYESLRTQAAAEHSWQRAVRAFAESSAERLAPGTRRQLHRPPIRTSVSELETYATCPFKHFARYVLRLDERAAAELEPVDAGKIHHALLEEFVGDLARGNRGIGGLKEEELAAGLERSYDRVLPRLERQAVLSPAREGYLLRRASGDLRKVLRAQGIVAAAGGARPRATELPFGFRRPGSLPALELTTPQGRRVHVRGYIDRVDLAEYADELLGIVVDYKRTRDKRLRLDEAYHGLSLQLLTYLVVLAEHGRTLAGRAVEPLGAFYVSLVPSYTVVEHPSDEREVEKAARAPFRPRGLLNADRAAALEEATGAWARHYSFYLKKDGGAGLIDSTDAAGGEAFRGMLEHTRRTLGRLVDDLCDGNVDVRPYRLGTASPCGWCPYAAACRFEIDLNEPRYLLPMKRSEVFSRLRETAERSDPASDASGPPDVRS